MKVRMNTIMAGPAGTAGPGSIVEVTEEHGQSLLAGGYGRIVEEAAASSEGPTAEEELRAELLAMTNRHLADIVAKREIELETNRPTKDELVEAIMQHNAASDEDDEDAKADEDAAETGGAGDPAETAAAPAGENAAARTGQAEPRQRRNPEEGSA